MSTARILIVEDHPTNLGLMEYLLQAFGHTVLVARDGEEGVEAALRERPDLVLMDLQLPRLSGTDALRRIRELLPDGPPVIAVTSFAMVGDRERALAAGFDGYLAKPIEPTTFVPSIEEYLPVDLRSRRTGQR